MFRAFFESRRVVSNIVYAVRHETSDYFTAMYHCLISVRPPLADDKLCIAIHNKLLFHLRHERPYACSLGITSISDKDAYWKGIQQWTYTGKHFFLDCINRVTREIS